MTSGHHNTAYGSSHNSHSSSVPHTNSAANLGTYNLGTHNVTWDNSETFPLDVCEGSLSKLYERSEAIRNQFNSYSKKVGDSRLPTAPTTIQLGSSTDINSLAYKLLYNGNNDSASQYLPASGSISLRLVSGASYHTSGTWSGGHQSSGRSTHTSTYSYSFTGDLRSGTASLSVAGSKTVYLSYCIPVWATGGITSETVDGASGTLATKSTMDTLWKSLSKFLVKTSSVSSSTLSLSANNYTSGHDNHGSYCDDYSKREYKNNIEKYDENALDKINDVDIVRFNYKPEYGDPTIDRIGFIANDTDEIFSTHYHDRMDYMNCIGMLMKSVQELSLRVKELEDKYEHK